MEGKKSDISSLQEYLHYRPYHFDDFAGECYDEAGNTYFYDANETYYDSDYKKVDENSYQDGQELEYCDYYDDKGEFVFHKYFPDLGITKTDVDREVEEYFADEIIEYTSDRMEKHYDKFLKGDSEYERLLIEVQSSVAPIPLIIRGIAITVNEEKLRTFLNAGVNKPLDIQKVNLPLTPDGKCKGTGVVYLNDVRSAIACINKKGLKLENQPFSISAFFSSKTGTK
eukprot:CAMPEP_0115023024 /NCGR_PEP_ID=MMETSP0216-20121206/32056_1 /TAXON_ID=223996 /ORGANISM="Protocruzia adherens, Strain Boccale" /LENGTH=226 /DNA_ID=CAMNT_0002396133 /DNA_START=38 /DNA_END=718 /DNA_ORIENTATION=-